MHYNAAGPLSHINNQLKYSSGSISISDRFQDESVLLNRKISFKTLNLVAHYLI